MATLRKVLLKAIAEVELERDAEPSASKSSLSDNERLSDVLPAMLYDDQSIFFQSEPNRPLTAEIGE